MRRKGNWKYILKISPDFTFLTNLSLCVCVCLCLCVCVCVCVCADGRFLFEDGSTNTFVFSLVTACQSDLIMMNIWVNEYFKT